MNRKVIWISCLCWCLYSELKMEKNRGKRNCWIMVKGMKFFLKIIPILWGKQFSKLHFFVCFSQLFFVVVHCTFLNKTQRMLSEWVKYLVYYTLVATVSHMFFILCFFIILYISTHIKLESAYFLSNFQIRPWFSNIRSKLNQWFIYWKFWVKNYVCKSIFKVQDFNAE